MKTILGRRAFTAGMAAAVPAVALPAAAQAYPSQLVKLVVPFGAGSASDNIARILADEMRLALGQTVLIDNRPGASGFIGTTIVTKAPADGYTLLVDASATHSANPWLFKNVPYDPIKDFTHISRWVELPQVVIASPGVPAKTLGELVDHGRANPGKLTFGYGTPTALVGASTLVTLGRFEALAVPYKTPAAALQAVMSDEVSFMVADLSTALPQIRAGKVKGMAISTTKRMDALAEVPTLAEAGYSGFDTVLWIGLSGPAGLPKEVVDRLSAAMSAIFAKPEVQARIVAIGMQPAPSTPADFTAFVTAQLDVWGKRIKAAGIQPE
ncbi:MAG: tripartite tricarboxylate transporter substrate binding protein [Reyranella sp.]|nr:tripartite tricarboxylate transporter substrate binding protein [Reyranella sp.]